MVTGLLFKWEDSPGLSKSMLAPYRHDTIADS